jgi:hypothetical protein
VYTLGALLALVVHLDRLGRLLRGGRRPRLVAARLATARPAQVRDPD